MRHPLNRLLSARAEVLKIRQLFIWTGEPRSVFKTNEILSHLDGLIAQARTAAGLPDRSKHEAIHHLDGNPHNNDLSNLRIVDIRENLAKLAPDGLPQNFGEGEV